MNQALSVQFHGLSVKLPAEQPQSETIQPGSLLAFNSWYQTAWYRHDLIAVRRWNLI
jgi:hypothetical protein